MSNKRVADYFVIAGFGENPTRLDDSVINAKNSGLNDPITDIGIVFPLLGETVPHEYSIIETTPTGLSANLHSGSFRSSECYICIRRGLDRPPLIDIGVLNEGRESLLGDSEMVTESFGGLPASVSNSTNQKVFLTYRRNNKKSACNVLVVTDICVINSSRNESPPHTFFCAFKNLNKGFVGNDMFLCYKKSMNRPKLISYKPEIICRFPEHNLEKFTFPEIVPLFCLPMGVSLEVWPKDTIDPGPMFSTFVLTVSDAKEKVYGSAVSFYEDFPSSHLTKEQEALLDFDENLDVSLHVNKSVCILSHWPFSDGFEQFLFFLYEKINSKRPLDIPIERYVVQLIDEVPFPNPRTLIQLSAEDPVKIVLTQPEESPLPRNAAGFCNLLLNLKPDKCIQLLLLALTEQKILVHSLRTDILTATVEAVSAFLFPFKWQCPYIPLCPLSLAEVLHAPLPFLIGVDSRFFDLYDLPSGINCVDLDAGNITLTAEQRNLTAKMLPKKACKVLRNTLTTLFTEIRSSYKLESSQNKLKSTNCKNQNVEFEFERKKRNRKYELRIQEAFLRFMTSILKGYRSYLLPITRTPTVGTTDAEALFQMNAFLRSRDRSHQKFFNMLMRTQMFIKFIEERSFVADGNQELAFFDECIERLAIDDAETHLMVTELSETNDRTFFLMPPEPLTPEGLFVYDHFEINPNLLYRLRENNLHTKQFKSIADSPLLKRTKQEIRTAKKIATRWSLSADSWVKYLLGTCYSLQIMMLPNLLRKNKGKEKTILCDFYELLLKASRLGLYCDEVCYRIMMQFCGEHSIPLLAVKLLMLMKRSGIQPNALTYGLYNRCVLEAEWPSYSSSSQLLWNKLKYVILATASFRSIVNKKTKNQKQYSSLEEPLNSMYEMDRVSNVSCESKENLTVKNLSEKLNFCSILKPNSSISQTNLFKTDECAQEKKNIKTLERALSMKLSDCLNLTTLAESFASDTNILRKLQKYNYSSKLFGSIEKDTEHELNTCTNESLRIPVTKSDPLGALAEPEEQVVSDYEPEQIDENVIFSSTEMPVLFRGTIPKSSTFEQESPNSAHKIQRSETIPVSNPVTLSLSHLGSSLRLNFSPSSLTGKTSNELFQEGISSLKSAANSVVKKFDEIKEAISLTPTKMPNASINRTNAYFDTHLNGSSSTLAVADYDSTDDGSDNGDRNQDLSSDFNLIVSNLQDFENNLLLENLYKNCNDEINEDFDIEIVISSCFECYNCCSLLYDEDILANWSADDSNLNTICHCCRKSVVPLLTICILKSNSVDEPFRVPYLSPLVLRKELETILINEGDSSLSKIDFIEKHPIIYWNLLWMFERIDAITYFPDLYLEYFSKKTISNQSTNDDSDSHPLINGPNKDILKSIVVRCLWDDPRMHSQCLPLYFFWHKEESPNLSLNSLFTEESLISKSLVQSIIGSILCGDFLEPIKQLLNERDRKFGNAMQSISIYREILFLFVKAVDRKKINLITFDREYLATFERLRQDNEYSKLLKNQDKPIDITSILCRQFFKPLTLP